MQHVSRSFGNDWTFSNTFPLEPGNAILISPSNRMETVAYERLRKLKLL